MNDQEEELRSSATGAEAVEIQAADWILCRRLAENWTEADQAAFDAWSSQSLANRLAYLRLDAIWARAHRLAALRPLNRPAVAPSMSRKWQILTRVMAVLSVAGVLGIGFAYLSRKDTATYSTTLGEHKTIALADGSRVDLNTDTVLMVLAGQRRAILKKGEAIFRIKHDASQPFSVLAADYRVTDIGTEFVVRNEPDRLKVTLLEGRARFEASGLLRRTQVTTLSPGDVVEASADSIALTKEPLTALKHQTAWQRGVLMFDGTTLADAAKELNRYNTEKLIIADDVVGRLRFDATIPTDGVQVFARVTRQVFGLHVESRRGEVVISR